MSNRRMASAYTLIELLVVIGLMAALAGGLGLAMRSGNPAMSLKAGQATVAALLAAARAQGALLGVRVMLIVDADAGSEEFLRRLWLAAEDAADSDHWQVLDDGELLPAGVFVVPAELNLPGVAPAAESRPWPAGITSSLRVATSGAIAGAPGGSSGKYLRMRSPMGPSELGRILAGDWVVLAPGYRTAVGVELGQPAMARGVLLSDYGIALLVDGAASFGF